MCHAAWYPGATGETVHLLLDSWTQTKLQEDAALQVSSYRECLEPLAEHGSHGFLACRRCAVVKELCCQVKELQAKWQDRPMGWERDQLDVLWDQTASRAWVFNCSREARRACPHEVGKWKPFIMTKWGNWWLLLGGRLLLYLKACSYTIGLVSL